MTIQPDLFGRTNSDPLLGLQVRIDHNDHCHDDVAELHPGTHQHAYALRCAVCGRHRGWLPRASVPFLEKVLASFGKPTTPIVLRNSRHGV
jgi:hypothetical protein